jgi:DeoR/GlpR family transcriptional regulator of sugar metabolism
MTRFNNISAEQRRRQIRNRISQHQQAGIAELANEFGVSEMTIRRDLDRMEKFGQVQRTHGGAVAAERMIFEFDFARKRQTRRREKQAIARGAMDLVRPGQRLILDTGTTTLELAYLLKDFDNLTVITPSLAVAGILQFSNGIQIILLGGVIRRGGADLTGAVTETNLAMFAADIAFQGADALSPDGAIYSDDLRIARVDQLIRQRADRNYVLADSSKIGKTALTVNGYLPQIDGLITDDGIETEHLENFRNMGANVIVVKKKQE